MSGGSRVHNDDVILPRFDQFHQFDNGHELIHARQRQFEETANIVFVEIGASVGDFGQNRTVFELELGEQAFGVGLAGEKIIDSPDGNGSIADRLIEAIAHGMCGIESSNIFRLGFRSARCKAQATAEVVFAHASFSSKENKPPLVFQKAGLHVSHIQTS